MMKTQIQTAKGIVRFSGLLDTASAIVVANGPRGLYKGENLRLNGKVSVESTDYVQVGGIHGKLVFVK